MVPSLQSAMVENVTFKRNASKNIGNYNLARCRDVTDKADRLWLEAAGLTDLWEDIELEHSLVVRTSFDKEQADVATPSHLRRATPKPQH